MTFASLQGARVCSRVQVQRNATGEHPYTAHVHDFRPAILRGGEVYRVMFESVHRARLQPEIKMRYERPGGPV